MPNDASEVVVGASGKVMVAPADTAVFPSTMSAFNAVWDEVGFVSEDGVTFTDGKTIEGIGAWQSFYHVRKLLTEKSASLEFVMRQWNEDNLKTAFGGGSISRTAGVTTYRPPAPGEISELAMAVEWTDGADTYRLVIPRGIVGGEVQTNLVRTGAADLPIAFEIAPNSTPDGVTLSKEPWYFLTNAPQFAIT